MVLEFTAVSAIVPSLLLIWYFHTRDVYPEPPRVIWATFGLGVLTVVPVLIVALPLAIPIRQVTDPFLGGFLEAFLTAGIPEEFFKFLVVVLYCSRHREFDEPMDGIVYGAIASLGFATFENVLYVSSGGTSAALMRAFTAVPGHAFMGAIMGYFVGQARFNPARRGPLLATGYLAAMTLHTLYDFPLLTLSRLNSAHGALGDAEPLIKVGLALFALCVLAFEWVWAVRLSRRLRRDQQAGQLAQARAMAQAPQPMAPPPGYAPAPQPWPAVPLQAPWPANPQPPYQPGWPPPAYRNAPRWIAAQRAPPSAGSWLLLLVGGVLTSIGGLMLLGVVLLAAQGRPPDGSPAVLALTALLFGVLPLGLGGLLFVLGVRGLNRAHAAARAMGYR